MDRKDFDREVRLCGIGRGVEMPDGRWVMAVESEWEGCEGCFFSNNCVEVNGVGCRDACCVGIGREDGRDVIFVEVKGRMGVKGRKGVRDE